jgi:purine nucleosidase
MDQVRAFGNPVAQVAMDCNVQAARAAAEQSGETGLSLPDPVAMTIALDPAACPERTMCYVDVETQSELTRGMTVVDRFGVSIDERNAPVWGEITARPRNASICWALDIPRWKGMLYDILR